VLAFLPENGDQERGSNNRMPAVDKSAMGGRIRERREGLGLTQRGLAAALQVSAQAVSKWELGDSVPDVDVLVDLARLLGVSVDFLLGSHLPGGDVVEATVLLSDLRGYARKSDALSVADGAAWLNGRLFQVTEAILRHDGIVVKYMGDATLAFFTGAQHRDRALRAATLIHRLLGDGIQIGLHSGEVYVGRIGHPDHARLDILGPTVNVACSLGPHSSRAASHVAATAAVVEGAGDSFTFGPGVEATFRFTDTRFVVHDLVLSEG
jgi:class 3 adenylate cyclase